MLKPHLKNILILSILFTLTGGKWCNKCFSQDNFSPIKTIIPNAQIQPTNEMVINLDKNQGNTLNISLTKNDSFYNFNTATDKFVECNIRASWEDFRNLIKNSSDNDFMYISYANKMADLGLFDLADFASSKIRDKALGDISTDAMKRFYYPRKKMKLDTELTLAEAYSNILYNNQSSETVNELLKNESALANYDYANYIIALGSYQSNSYSRAAKYINLAILQNPTNLNYQKLKAQILSENNEPAEALKIVENLKKQNLYSYEYERKINSLEQFILYKTTKQQWEKDYHLGYYYYYENDFSKAVRTLQSSLSTKKKATTGTVYGLMSRAYLNMNEFEKAADTAKKSYKINSNNYNALITLGDLSYKDKNYKQALYYYKRAAAEDKKSYTPLVKEAQAYQQLANSKKAAEIYAKVLKTYSDSWEAYYYTALLDKDKEKQVIYLKKSLAVNPMFENGWIELARTDIDRGNYEAAQKYLSNAFYIDENDFKYYYYQGLLNVNTGSLEQAKYNFKKCLKLNSNCTEAKKELDKLLEPQNTTQDNI